MMHAVFIHFIVVLYISVDHNNNNMKTPYNIIIIRYVCSEHDVILNMI